MIPVVELSTHPGTSEQTVARAREFMQSIGKLPVVCGVAPGYIVPRLQALVMNEAARMVEEGVATAEQIDLATRYGMGGYKLGDSTFLSAMVTKARWYATAADFTYRGLSAFYPPLFGELLGKLARP